MPPDPPIAVACLCIHTANLTTPNLTAMTLYSLGMSEEQGKSLLGRTCMGTRLHLVIFEDGCTFPPHSSGINTTRSALLQKSCEKS